MFPLSQHHKAVLQALFVTFLWSTSFVLIKKGLDDIPALTFASLRYALAFGLILAMVLRSGKMEQVRQLSRHEWGWLALLGVVYYSITQGSQFLALERLPAVTLSLMLNFSAIIIAVISIFWLAERPSPLQWVGMLIFMSGVLVYFYPISLPASEWVGIGIGAVSVLSNSLGSVLGRYINRREQIPAQIVTLVSMGIGAGLLLSVSLWVDGLPRLSLENWLLLAWLAAINTAFAFVLWNHTLRILPAMESSIINNTMLIQIGLLAWIFLGESINFREGVGMLIAFLGILTVQLRLSPKA